MNLLEKIINFKKKEVYNLKYTNPISFLEKSIFFKRKCFSLKKRLENDDYGIISEFKRKSPINGFINTKINIKKVVLDYELSGVSGISILNEKKFFNSKDDDINKTRHLISKPILFKDFIISSYQIFLAKSLGADVILLIAKILSKKMIYKFSLLAKKLGLEIILEIHQENELYKIHENLDIIGVNNRNLENFSIDINNSLNISYKIPNNLLKISESGISNIEDIFFLKKNGFNGFLIGGVFMSNNNPGKSCINFMKKLLNNKIKK